MLNFHRVAQLLFPSVTYKDQARILAAMEGREPQDPVSSSQGEGSGEAGQSEGGDGPAVSFGSSPPPPVPAVEVLRNWRAHPAHRWEFTDSYLAAVLDQWGATS